MNSINNILEENLDKEHIVENYEELYDKIEVGDIVWAKRYQNDEEKEKIPEGHREGPYIVLKKQDNKLICTQGRGVVPYEEFYDVNFYLNNNGYYLSKDTFFCLTKLVFIDEETLIRVTDKLNQVDKDRLYKKIKVLRKTYYTEGSKMIRLDLPIQLGDIIDVDNNKFIVIDINNNKLVCVPLNNKISFKYKSQLSFNNFDNLDYSKIIYLENNTNIKYINTVSNKHLNYILKNFKIYLYNCKNMGLIQRGNIILKDDKYYYIYGEEGETWFTFEISKINILNNEKIEIGNDTYYTSYDDVKINKKEQFTNCYLCTDEEKDKIKFLRKSYKENKKREDLYGTSETFYFKVGDIIENINCPCKRYIVIKNYKKTYKCLSIDNLKKGIYAPIILKLIEAKVSKNTSIEGIKWFEEHKNFELERIADENVLEQILEYQKQFANAKENEKQVIKIDLVEKNKPNKEENSIGIDSIIKKKGFSEERFVVKSILGNILVCRSCDTKGQKIYFNKDEVMVVKNKQKRK